MEILERRLTIDSNERRVLVIVTRDKEVLFKCKDVARLLDYKNTKCAIARLVPRENKHKLSDIIGVENSTPSVGVENSIPRSLEPHTLFMDENGAIDFVCKSCLPSSTEIIRWFRDSKDICL